MVCKVVIVLKRSRLHVHGGGLQPGGVEFAVKLKTPLVSADGAGDGVGIGTGTCG